MPHDHDSKSEYTRGSSHQDHSQLLRSKSNESKGNRLCHPREKHRQPNVAMDTMSRALRRIAWSPFVEEIERIEMLRHFTRPSFTCYDGKIDPMEHVSHFTKLIVLYSWNDLLCKVFPSSLGHTAIR